MVCKSVLSRTLKTFVVALSIPLLAGCVAEQRLAWSPDGKKMALVGADGVRVSVDGGMHLSEPVEEDAQLVAWFPDSKRVAVVTKSDCGSWVELEHMVDKEEVEAIKAGGAQMLKGLESCGGDFAMCRDTLMKENFNAAYLQPILYYLRSTAQDSMQRLVGKEWSSMKPLDSFVLISRIKLFEVDSNGNLQHKQTLACTADNFDSVKVSPSNEFVSLVDKDGNLCLAQTKSGSRGYRIIASKFAKLPDWDFNTDLIYGLRSVKKAEKKGEIEAQELVSVDVRKSAAIKRLASASTANGKVRATVDGNLIFGSIANIPSGKRGKFQPVDALNVMNLTSGKTKRVYVAAPGDRLENFEVSPDGKNISVPNTSGALKVVSLPSGKYRVLVAGNPKNERDVFTPVWKNNDEVCFERLTVKDDIGQVALFSLSRNTSKDISVKWPPKAVFGLLNNAGDKKLSFEQMLKDLQERKKTKVKA
ncbi:MAG TPA: hypothetical protein PKZ32_05215 [Candidatus Melainabacteria bacterium]|nr:hypothetical protein [Candidatus Melainabacteria bacterium]